MVILVAIGGAGFSYFERPGELATLLEFQKWKHMIAELEQKRVLAGRYAAMTQEMLVASDPDPAVRGQRLRDQAEAVAAGEMSLDDVSTVGGAETEPPVIDGVPSAMLQVVEGDDAAPVAEGAMITPGSSLSLRSLSISLGGGAPPTASEVLRLDPPPAGTDDQNDLVAAFNLSTATLRVAAQRSDQALTVAQLESALHRVLYAFVGDNPARDLQSGRSVSLWVTDAGGVAGAPVERTVRVSAVNDEPVVVASSPPPAVVYNPGDPPVLVATAVSLIEDVDDSELAEAVVAVGATAANRHSLFVNATLASSLSLAASYDGVTGTLSITPSSHENQLPSLAQWLSLLETVGFSSLGEQEEVTLSVTVRVEDASGGSSLAVVTSTITVLVPAGCEPGYFAAYSEGSDSGSSLSCVECRAPCAAGQYEAQVCTSSSDRQCEPCHAACATCTAAGPQHCAQAAGDTRDCAEGYFTAVGATTSLCVRCSNCDDDEYDAGGCSGLQDRDCQQCHSSCELECSDGTPGGCASCGAGFFDNGAECQACSVCDNDEPETQACTATSDTACGGCFVGCVDSGCSGPLPDDCFGCDTGYWDAGDGESTSCTACSACSVGTFVDVSCGVDYDTDCTSCHSGCVHAGCSGSSASACTGCDEGYYEVDGACTPCAPECGQNEYESLPCGGTQNRECSACHAGCSSAGCTGPQASDCNACDEGYFDTVEGPGTSCSECTTDCGAGRYVSSTCGDESDSTCSDCDAACHDGSCTGPEAGDCTACGSGWYDSGDFGESVACGQCSDVCSTCDAPGGSGCTACNDDDDVHDFDGTCHAKGVGYREEYFLADFGQSCSDLCSSLSLPCSESVNTGDDTAMMEAALRDSCTTSSSTDEFVGVPHPAVTDGRVCVGYVEVADVVPCDGSAADARRFCRCAQGDNTNPVLSGSPINVQIPEGGAASTTVSGPVSITDETHNVIASVRIRILVGALSGDTLAFTPGGVTAALTSTFHAGGYFIDISHSSEPAMPFAEASAAVQQVVFSTTAAAGQRTITAAVTDPAGGESEVVTNTVLVENAGCAHHSAASCFATTVTESAFTSADTLCDTEALTGSQAASLLSTEEDAAAQAALASSGAPRVWLGMSRGTWQYVNGEVAPSSQLRWDSDEPAGGSCVNLRSNNGKFEADACAGERAFVCERRDAFCVSDWTDPSPISDDGVTRCFREFSDDTMSWEDAQGFCEGESLEQGASFLAMPDSEAANAVITDACSGRCWVGLSAALGWADGSDLDFTNWAAGHPTSVDCAVLEESEWKSQACTSESAAMCKLTMPRVAAMPSTAVAVGATQLSVTGSGFVVSDTTVELFSDVSGSATSAQPISVTVESETQLTLTVSPGVDAALVGGPILARVTTHSAYTSGDPVVVAWVQDSRRRRRLERLRGVGTAARGLEDADDAAEAGASGSNGAVDGDEDDEPQPLPNWDLAGSAFFTFTVVTSELLRCLTLKDLMANAPRVAFSTCFSGTTQLHICCSPVRYWRASVGNLTLCVRLRRSDLVVTRRRLRRVDRRCWRSSSSASPLRHFCWTPSLDYGLCLRRCCGRSSTITTWAPPRRPN